MKKIILSIVLFCACAGPAFAWLGDSFVAINGTLYRGSKGEYASCPGLFNGANLGTFASDFKLGGEVCHYDKTDTWAEIWYKIDNGSYTGNVIYLQRVGDDGNNSKHQNILGNTISIADLTEGNHTITVLFAMNGENETNNPTYTANFTVSYAGRNNVVTQLSDDLTLTGDLTIFTSSKIVSDGKTISANKIYIKHTVAASNAWEFISLPFAVTAVRGTGGASLTQNGNNGDYGLAIYNGEARANSGSGWSYYPTTLSAGAYAIWVDDSKVTDLTVLFETSATSTGAASSNSAAVNLAYNSGSLSAIHNGWNFVANPLLSNASTLIAEGQFTYTYNDGEYEVAADGSYSNDAFKSYFVKTAAAGSLSYNSTNSSPVAANTSVEKLTLFLNDTYKTTIRMKEFATNDYDELYDAPYMAPMSSFAHQIYTMNNAGKMAINSIPESTNIPLGFRFATAGEYTLAWDNQLVGTNVVLHDSETGADIDMTTQSSYLFTAVAGEINNRFSVGINRVPTGMIQIDGNVKVYSENNAIIVSGLNKMTPVRVYDLSGRTIANETIANSLRIPAQKGVYLVTVGDKRFKLINQ
ncbi:hypothetical protein FACS189413_11390 [Bacteroidia bacterium]|nr:hypothetical protein FACS189463_1600 [Bacteroidia bacterium]GHU70697.1 hypothetical protein FACS189413_11390 [Bacteroidia bacterium]